MKFTNDEFQVIRLGKQDVQIFQKLIELFHEVFEMKNSVTPTESYLESILAKPGFIAYAAIWKKEILGGLTAYELPMYYSEYSEVFIYDIAVKPGFQKKGVGKEMILKLKEYCRQNAIKEIFVAAHTKDKHALNFYQSTGGKAESVVHFNYPLL